jgi:hypothetical protein
MATDYKKNAAEAKRVVASLPKAQQAAAQKVIAQAAKTGKGVSNNELAFLQANTSKLSAKTDPKAFLGTLEQRQTFLQSQQVSDGDGDGGGGISAEEAARRAALEIEAARLQAQRTDWIEYTTQLFNNYGLGTLAPKITEYVQQGFSPDTVTLKLQETPEYKQRFAGNESRRKSGLSVLSPKEYLATEDAYRQIMRSTGLPKGFYDSPDDFSKFIESDVSPTELKQRVDLAQTAIDNADPYYTRTLQEMYGLSNGDMIAQVLDPQRALPFITKQAQAVQFGAAAVRQGLQVAKPVAEQYAGMGVTEQQAEQGFQAVAQILPTAERLGQIYGQNYNQEQALSEVFGGPMSADAIQRRRRLVEMEQSSFAGRAGVGRSSLTQGSQGQF